MAAIDHHRATGAPIPHLHRVIFAPRSKVFPIRRPGHRPHTVGMAAVSQGLLASGAVPHPHRVIEAGRGDARAVRGPGHRLHSTAMAAIDQDPFALVASHTCTVLSLPAEAMRVPSGDHATASTRS